MRGVLDTSVLVADAAPADIEAAISAASLAELHFGVLVATDEDERAVRLQRASVVEATFDPLPFDAAVAREWGRLAAAVVARAGTPRRRALDLVIAATANVHGAALITHDRRHFGLLEGLVDVTVLTPD